MFPTSPQIAGTAVRGNTDIDVVRPVGTDMTGVRLIQLRVPDQIARGLANRWIGDKGFIEVPQKRAIELSSNYAAPPVSCRSKCSAAPLAASQ
jgi:hypothetical protein